MNEKLTLTTDVIRQHTVPRFLLKQFSASGFGKRKRLYAFDKKMERSYATTPDDASVRNTFYNLDDHPDRISLEPLLAIYESDAAPVINSLLEHKDIRRLNVEERYKLAVFVAVQRARTFSEQERIGDFVSAVTGKLASIGATEIQAEEALGFSPRRDLRNLFLGQLVAQQPHIELLLAKDWYLCESSHEHPFYISDSPVVLHNNNNYGPYGNLGLGQTGIQIYLPLSSTVTLAMLCPSIREQSIELKKKIEWLLANAPQQIPRTMNPFEKIDIANRYENFLLKVNKPEEVVWLNNLQVKFSEQYVFCEKEEFSLARRMINDDHGYKSGPRITIG